MSGKSATKTPPASTAAPEPSSTTYTVLARRYRPQQFADLVGQEAVAQALRNALESNRVAHAYLFTGARGVGKTSAARILAKALNCARGPTPTPCGTCDVCQSIAAGEDVDVLEVDAASNRGIDEVREIRQNVRSRPGRARYKIYIVDEVHMLTKEAFNALLKTLEEPPPHVKFIFATTEVQKIPVTILSRCQRFDFPGISAARIVDRLREVVAAEGLQADDDALELVARRAGGSMRDAQSLLDQLLAFGGARLTVDQVHALLGTAHDDRVVALAGAAVARDARQALGLLQGMADQGLQLGELVDQLMDYWRDLMVVNCAGLDGQALSVSSKYRETLGQHAQALKTDTILAGLEILDKTKARLRFSGQGRVLVEMALVRLCRLEDLVPLAQLAGWLSQPGAAPAATAARPAAPVAPPEAPKKKMTEPGEVVGQASNLSGVLPDPQHDLTPDTSPTLALSAESLPQVWKEVLHQVGAILSSQLEKAGNLAISGPNALVARFAGDYTREREFCQDPTRVARVEDALRKVTGQAWVVRIESGGSTAASSHTPAPAEGSNSQFRTRSRRAEVEKHPLVKRTMEVLGAQIVREDEGFGAAPLPAPGAARPTALEEA